MTEQKSLKRLVRERMSRTGESYTTAHRHVTARRDPSEAAPAMYEPGLVPGYSSFGPEGHQPSALVRHMLAVAGIDVSEPMACGLGGGVGFLYAVFDYRQVDHLLLTIVAQHHPMPWPSAVAQNLGLELETVHSSSATAARRKLDACLDRGEPAQLTVGRGLLPQHPDVSLEAADPYQVVVAGRHGDEYLVDDLAPTPHLIEGDRLLEAWAAHRKGRFEQSALVRKTTAPIAGDVRSALALATAGPSR
ncbi:MAG: BtrH N-terminal domain-containing protein [Nocardioidaceae bacterium]